MGRKDRRHSERAQMGEWQAVINSARRKWLGKTVQVNMQTGQGVVLAKVTNISNGGDVVVEPLTTNDSQFVGAVMSLGYIDRVLTLVS